MDNNQQKIRVLIIEDHQVTLDGLVSGLSNEIGLEIVGTGTRADDGLALAKDLEPDVILLDLYLPGSQGPKTTVQAYAAIPGSKVIVFSVENRRPFINTVLEAGASGYLLKSENASTVAEVIRTVFYENRKIAPKEIYSPTAKITRSEEEILKMLARGMKYEEIAEKRQSSPATVRKQCETLSGKLALTNREKLIAWAVQNGYDSLEIDQ